MNRFLLVAGALVISTSAFAQANSPTRKGDKCWNVVDLRGFGYWGKCSDVRPDPAKRRYHGLDDRLGERDRMLSRDDSGIANMSGGGGGGGGD